MKISSYNITDVAYHYIGLRVLGGLEETARREEQTAAVSRNVAKYSYDKALRLMLPEPRGTFETVGEKVCQELVHFGFALAVKGRYELTETGRAALGFLDGGRYADLRRLMVCLHLETYSNLRTVVLRHIELGSIWRPIVEISRPVDFSYLKSLLEPALGEAAVPEAERMASFAGKKSRKKLEDALQESVLQKTIPNERFTVSLFRSLCDRLVSLRLLNIAKVTSERCDFFKSYSSCVLESPQRAWHIRLDILIAGRSSLQFYFSEPDFSDKATQSEFLAALDIAFSKLEPRGGYYYLPDVRDLVCEQLNIPEQSFDEGINHQLDLDESPFTMGLSYEGISGRRKPLMRTGKIHQIYNLIRRK